VLCASLSIVASSSDEAGLLTLADLATAEELVMSCADAGNPHSSEPLWCADPTSPQCLPGLPPAQRAELRDAQTLFVSLAPVHPSEPRFVLDEASYPAVLAGREPARRSIDPLERPPRA
jgi:hypothetical protein